MSNYFFISVFDSWDIEVTITEMILESANGGATKTKIMYKAFLSYVQLKEYLAVLEKNGLLEYEDGMRSYRTTEKGIRLLRIYNQVDELVALNDNKWKIRKRIDITFSIPYSCLSLSKWSWVIASSSLLSYHDSDTLSYLSSTLYCGRDYLGILL